MKPLTGLLTAIALAVPNLSTNAEILVGVAAPTTGPYAWTGERVVQGAEIAIEDLNAKGGVLGQPLKALVVDDYCDSQQAVAAAHKLIEAEVTVVFGHQCSGAMIAASELYEASGIIVISPAATNPLVTDRGLKMAFRTSGRDDQQGKIAGDVLAEKWGAKNIAIIHDDQAYGRGIAEQVSKRLDELGVKIKIVEQVQPGQKDFDDLVARLDSAKSDVVFYGGYQQEAGLIVRQTKERLPQVEFILPDGVSGDDFPLIAGEAADGILMTSLADARQRAGAAAVVIRSRDAGFEPSGAYLYTYAAIQSWAQATEKVGTLDPDAVSSALRSHMFNTVLGHLGFDDKGDVTGIDTFDWFIWTDGEYVPIDGTSASD